MKYIKKLLFGLFILLMVGLMGFLGIKTYIQASSSRAIEYMIEKYEITKKDIKVLKYQEYAYSDITNCESLWFKKCTDEQGLIYSFKLEIKGKTKVTVKEYKNKVFEDDYEGKVRDSYLKKIELLDKNGIVKIEDTEGSN
jgi:hypothetical protein